MIKRVVAYGCSHAYGSEMSGRFDDTGSREFVYGNLVAKHYGVPFHRVAQPGNSNEGILHNTIEHCEEGDLAIFSSIELKRAVYHPMSDDDPIRPQNITEYECTMICEEYNKTLPSWLPFSNITKMKKEFEGLQKHNIIKHMDLPHVSAVAEYFIGYRWEFLPLFLDYLKYYTSWNAIAKSRGAYPINFMALENKLILKEMLHYEGVGPHFRNSKGDPDYTHERMPHTLNTSRHYKDWLDDPTRICKGYLPLLRWVLQKQNLDIYTFPDNRMGHCGKEQQPFIAQEIIKRCENLGYE